MTGIGDDQSFSGTCPTCGQRYCGAELERLRARLVESDRIADGYYKELRKAMAEIERLRAEVRELKDELRAAKYFGHAAP